MKHALKYIPNFLTLTRLLLTPLFVIFIFRGTYMSAVLVFVAICLTDILDGVTARAFGASTIFGAYLDVTVDLIYVMVSLIALNLNKLTPVWFTFVVALKFCEFAVTSYIIKRKEGIRNIWIFDRLGRCFSALAFLSPGIFCFIALLSSSLEYFVFIFLIPTSVFAIVSFTGRVMRCTKSLKSNSTCVNYFSK